MRINIFDISDKTIIVNQECLLIPELKAVVEYYENPVPALCYLYYMFDPASAYNNVPFNDKEDMILADFPGDYTTEDEVIINASIKLKKLYMTPTLQYYLDSKVLLEKLGKYGRNNEVYSGKDGNYSAMQSQIKSVGKTVEEFKKLEDIVQKEIEELSTINARGGKRLSYDET